MRASVAHLVVSLALLGAGAAVAADPPAVADLSYYLPDEVAYDESVPTPQSVLGYEVGEWHVRHDQLVEYFRVLASSSPRVTLEEYGRTHERRPLLLAAVTSAANHRRLDELRAAHVAALDPADRDAPVTRAPDDDARPIVVWLGYSVHGNEPSGANASMVFAYHLAAARGRAIDELLERAIVLIDPAINPDGLGRFAQWANSHRGQRLVADPAHREHREVWPGGRTNHYWFDLNRDWLLLTHPESRRRLVEFHKWKPNVLADFHEMGTESTYFFQPGVPSRQNPNTPWRNLELTRELASHHASILDAAGSLYYTEETFDDFYYGKGSTYPDVNGAIGILFEQASSRGHLQESSFGDLAFPFTIRNQFFTSLSTVQGAVHLREKLLRHQRQFYRSAAGEATEDTARAYVFGTAADPHRLRHFLDVLLGHRIRVARLAEELEVNGRTFDPPHSFVVPLAQPQYRLAKALFETRTAFADTTFYDVSTWTLPLAFGIPYAELTVDDFDAGLAGEAVEELPSVEATVHDVDEPYAYLFQWHGYYAPRAVNRLLSAGYRVRATTRPFEVETERGTMGFDHGTIVVARGIQEKPQERLRELFNRIAAEDGIDVHAVASGLTVRGVDLGSPSIREVAPPKPLLVVGSGVSSYEAGEVWFLLDHRFGLQLSMVELGQVSRIDLERYTHVILVSGSYGALGDRTVERLRDWIGRGGVLVATAGSVGWAEKHILERTAAKPDAAATTKDERQGEEKSTGKPERLPYAEYEKRRSRQRIAGAIFEADVDVTHPLGFGHKESKIAVFRNSTRVLRPEDDPFATVVRYTGEPLLSGYCSAENLEKLRGTAVVCATRKGRGLVVRIVDNMNFRGVWYGTSKLFVNALYFGSLVRDTSRVLEQ